MNSARMYCEDNTSFTILSDFQNFLPGLEEAAGRDSGSASPYPRGDQGRPRPHHHRRLRGTDEGAARLGQQWRRRQFRVGTAVFVSGGRRAPGAALLTVVIKCGWFPRPPMTLVVVEVLPWPLSVVWGFWLSTMLILSAFPCHKMGKVGRCERRCGKPTRSAIVRFFLLARFSSAPEATRW